MIKKSDNNIARLNRHKRVRGKIVGTKDRPRLNVFRSSKNIYAQIIDDGNKKTLVAASTLSKDFKGKTTGKEAARQVGELIAKYAKENNINEVVFDRGGYIYHGRVKELAEGAREGGLKF